MKLKEVSPRKLENRHERACARLAELASEDIYWGSVRAANTEARLKKLGSEIPNYGIVSYIYGRSDASLGKWGAYECPECGQVCLGTENALKCCAPSEDCEENHE